MSKSVSGSFLAQDFETRYETESITFEPGSFRDRSSRVFTCRGEIYRALDTEARNLWLAVSQQAYYRQMAESGQIVKTEMVSDDQFNSFRLPPEFVAALRHEKIPFVSYPYEWSFDMLRDAALLQLNLLHEAVQCGMILKDASPYNVQFNRAQPVFIDLGSFTRLKPGEPWSAYRQFCETMLYPLMLQAYRGIDFQPLMRSQLEGIPSRQFLQLLRNRDLLRPGVFTHAWLQRFLERKVQGVNRSAVTDLQSCGFDSSLIVMMLRKLIRIVEKMTWDPPSTQWTNYDETIPHVAEDGLAKRQFVGEVCETRHRHLVWDLGCNDGRYSQIACQFATTVVSMDQDRGCVNRLYKSLQASQKNILPICVDLANPSPAQGWHGKERRRLEDRGRPELVLCLGLIHHLVIAANVPLPDVIEWLASLSGEIVLEFPSKNDAMVKSLLRNKLDQYSDYSLEHLVWELEKHFHIWRKTSLPSGERTLFHAVPKSPS